MSQNAASVSLETSGFRDAALPFFHERGFRTLGDFVKYTADQLVKMGIVKRRLGFVREKLAEHGLTLKNEGVSRTRSGSTKLTPAHQPKTAEGKREDSEDPTDETPEGDEDIAPLGTIVLPDGTTDLNAFTKRNKGLAYSFVHRSHYKYLITKEDSVDLALEIDDLYQEAFMGFLTAIQKFDPALGYKFSTYSYVWFRQKLDRAIKNSGTIRIPVHMWENIRLYIKTEETLRRHDGQRPSPEDMQRVLGLSDTAFEGVMAAVTLYRSRVTRINRAVTPKKPSKNGGPKKSSDGQDGGKDLVVDGLVTDDGIVSNSLIEDREEDFIARLTVQRVLANANLLEAEQIILIRRFGLDGDTPKTLEEVGQEFGVTRERIRQREAAALKKLRDPSLWEARTEDVENLSDQDSAETVKTVKKPAPVYVYGRHIEPGERTYSDLILQSVCEWYGTERRELLGIVRDPYLKTARQVLMYLLWEYTYANDRKIGEYLGLKGGSTVGPSYWHVRNHMKAEPELKKDVLEIRWLIGTKQLKLLGKAAS